MFKNKLIQSRFLKNIMTVSLGVVVSKIITLITMPLITRMYGVEPFSNLAIFSGLLILFISTSTLSLSSAIPLPKERDEAFGVFHAAIKVCVFYSLAIFLLIFSLVKVGLLSTHFSQIGFLLFLIPVAVLANGLSTSIVKLLSREQQFRNLAKSDILANFYRAMMRLGLGFVHPKTGVLIFTEVTYESVKSIFLVSRLKLALPDYYQQILLTRKKIKKIDVFVIAKKYKSFIIYQTPQKFIKSAGKAFPILIVAGSYGAEHAAYYVLALSMLAVFGDLISRSVGLVYYPRFNKAYYERDKFKDVYFLTTFLMSLCGLGVFIAISIAGTSWVGVIFGEDWSSAGEMFFWMAIYLFFHLVKIPSTHSSPALKEQPMLLLIEAMSSILRIFGLIIAIWFGASPSDAVGMSIVLCILPYIAFVAIISKKIIALDK